MKYPVSKSFGPAALLFGDEERQEVMDVLETGYLFRYGDENDPNFNQKVFKLEKEFADYIGTKYCVCVNSGTSSLLCALAALGIGPGDEVIVPGYTFIASIAAIVNSKAVPVLAEIDESLTIDPDDIIKRITSKTKAILPVHMLGNPCQMDRIMEIAKKYNLYVIEDCCQCVGGSFRGKKLGSFGDVGCNSFNRYKTVNCGDGGAVVTNDEELYKRAFAFHDQGHYPARQDAAQPTRTFMGVNFRMNELSGAVMRAQLRRIDYVTSTLKANKKLIKDELIKTGVGFRKINDQDGEISTVLTLMFDSAEQADDVAARLGTKTQFNSGWHVYDHMEHLLSHSVPTQISCPWACPHYGVESSYTKGMLPKTDAILKRSVSIGIGIADKGNGVGLGANILSTKEELLGIAKKVVDALHQVL